MKRQRLYLILAAVMFFCVPARAEKIKTLVDILGAVERHVEGIGIVTGLNQTGDKSQAALKLIKSYLEANNYNLALSDLSTNNMAIVKIDATIPPFIRPGQKLDVRVTALGDATSLENGSLMNCSLRFRPDGQIVAWASGRVLVGGGTQDTIHPTVGRIPANGEGGAQVIVAMPTDFVQPDNSFRLVLKKESFADAASIARAINTDEGTNPFLQAQIGFESAELTNDQKVSRALDAGLVEITIPYTMLDKKVEYMQEVLALDVAVERPAKVLLNRMTNTVIITGEVRVDPVAISHRNLTVTLPAMAQGGETRAPQWELNENSPRSVVSVEGPGQMPNLQSLINTLNSMGVTTSDVIVILEKLKNAGALHAQLIVE